jgi:predicted NUDIX family NTP pyrophosphohydrolase
MPKQSAGILMYRRAGGRLEVLLAHPGGPFWRNKDDGAWTMPKGEYESGGPFEAAKREFLEETNLPVNGPFLELGAVRQKSGKLVHAWAAEGSPSLDDFRSNSFLLEWPPRSGRMMEFPEIDRVAFFDLETARRKIHPGQLEFLERLESCM